MLRLDRDRIIVLRKIPYRDADLIVRGINAQGAKVSYLAPSAAKSRRRFGGGVLEATNFIEVIFQSNAKPTNSLIRIQEAHILREFQGLRRNYDILQTSLSIIGLIDHVGQEGDSHGEELFNLLGHSLQYLSQNEIHSLALFRLHFLLKFLFQQGVLNLEPWMHSLLQCTLRDHENLQSEFRSLPAGEILDRLAEVEQIVQIYRETGVSQ